MVEGSSEEEKKGQTEMSDQKNTYLQNSIPINMRLLTLSIVTFFIPYTQLFAQPSHWSNELVEIHEDQKVHTFMHGDQLFAQDWHLLPQPQFWMKIMRLSSDSVLINVAHNRKVLVQMSSKDWHRQTEVEKQQSKDSLRRIFSLDPSTAINVTTGKSDFYLFEKVYPSLSEGVRVFEKNGVDPWYAQSILLIESPGQLKKSNVGAYGPFQLMPGVAKAQGLIVTKYTDERENFERSAYAAARLIKRSCIPSARRIASEHDLNYSESDLWFRLLVLHVYHAGALNVEAAVRKIQPKEGGRMLIEQLWQTTAASFGNNSQNYSQLALAAHLILHEMMYERCDEMFWCSSVN